MRNSIIQTVYYQHAQPRNELAANPKLNRAAASTLTTRIFTGRPIFDTLEMKARF